MLKRVAVKFYIGHTPEELGMEDSSERVLNDLLNDGWTVLTSSAPMTDRSEAKVPNPEPKPAILDDVGPLTDEEFEARLESDPEYREALGWSSKLTILYRYTSCVFILYKPDSSGVKPA